MHETSKCVTLRQQRGDFESYLCGTGIDIGCGTDPLRIASGCVTPWEREQGDASKLLSVLDNTYDFVYSSHCLEHLSDVHEALMNWWRVLRPGGWAYIVVPDYELYEKCTWPSLFNAEHKQTFSLHLTRQMVQRENHYHLGDLIPLATAIGFNIVRVTLESDGYDWNQGNQDQTLSGALAQICLVARKEARAGEAARAVGVGSAGGAALGTGASLDELTPKIVSPANHGPALHHATTAACAPTKDCLTTASNGILSAVSPIDPATGTPSLTHSAANRASSFLTMHCKPYPVRIYAEDRGNFSALNHSRILFYWPHGFGDWVQLAYITRFLNPTNSYWITRFGDDNTALMDGHDRLQPLYLGANSTHCGDGAAYQNQHFGLDTEAINGTEQVLRLPHTLYDACCRHQIDAMLWSSLPEAWGYSDYPYHSKPRQLLPSLVSPKALATLDIRRPLPSSVNFAVASWVTQWVETRLRNFTGFGERKMCLIARAGYTSIGKNWGHLFREELPVGQQHEGQECRDFMRLMLRKDPRWMFLVMEDRMFEGEHTMRDADLHCFSYAELFGTPDTAAIPFAWVMKVLVNLADLAVGVPAGPYHLSMAKPELPTIGLWVEHLPNWYDEPKPASLHLISHNIREQAMDKRPGSFFDYGSLHFRQIPVESRHIPGEVVVGAVEQLFS